MPTLIDELINGQLSQEIAFDLAQGNDGAVLAVLQRKDISRLGKITAHDIKQYLSLIDVRIPIMESTAPACKAVTLALEDFPVFDLTIPAVQAKFIALLDALVAETLIPDFTEEHKATLLAIATEQVSRLDEIGLNATAQDIAQARELI
jgi:hypothetical protein